MTQAATLRCVLCDQDKPQANFQMTSLGRKPMCRLCCYGKVSERKPAATKRSPPRSRDPRPTLPAKPVFVPLNADGRRIGELHPGAKLLDREIDMVFDLREAGMSYSQIATKMGISKSCVAHVIKGRRRCQLPERWVQLSPIPVVVRTPKRRGRPPTKSKPVHAPAVPEGVAELQSAMRAWR